MPRLAQGLADVAAAVEVRRIPTIRLRQHADALGPDAPLIKATAGVAIARRPPQLSVVPLRRRTARTVTFISAFVFALMLGAAGFQTQVAARQLQLDRLDRDLRTAENQYDALRQQRSELRSPGRLTQAATALGMVEAKETNFMTISPEVVAAVQLSVGTDLAATATTKDDDLTRFEHVKAATGANP